MKLTKHARVELILLTGLALGSCDLPQTYRASDADKLDVASANARNAVARVYAAEQRLDEIESKLNM